MGFTSTYSYTMFEAAIIQFPGKLMIQTWENVKKN